jgi:hypothetical protein
MKVLEKYHWRKKLQTQTYLGNNKGERKERERVAALSVVDVTNDDTKKMTSSSSHASVTNLGFTTL